MNNLNPEQEQGNSTLLSTCRLITCILPDDGSDHVVMQILRDEKHLNMVDSNSARGVAMLRPGSSSPGRLPESELVRVVEAVVPELQTEEILKTIYEQAGIGEPGRGVVWLGETILASTYSLPEDAVNE